jgi:hypothetical protein
MLTGGGWRFLGLVNLCKLIDLYSRWFLFLWLYFRQLVPGVRRRGVLRTFPGLQIQSFTLRQQSGREQYNNIPTG